MAKKIFNEPLNFSITVKTNSNLYQIYNEETRNLLNIDTCTWLKFRYKNSLIHFINECKVHRKNFMYGRFLEQQEYTKS